MRLVIKPLLLHNFFKVVEFLKSFIFFIVGGHFTFSSQENFEGYLAAAGLSFFVIVQLESVVASLEKQFLNIYLFLFLF